MSLTKYKLGELIEQVTTTNFNLEFCADDVMGMTITKEIIKTKADVSTTDLSKFLVVKPFEFIYNPRTHGKKIGFGYNNTKNSFLISWNNIAFRVKKDKQNVVLPDYLFLNFKRDEWDRFACFQSWGSSTEVFSWNSLCDMDIELPSIEIQQKYVDIYNSILANQQNCEKGLDDLKLVCDAYIEDLRRKIPSQEIGEYIKNTDRKTDNANFRIQGISKQQKFIDSESKTQGVDKNKYIVVEPMEFGYSPIHINDGSIALNDSNDTYLLSPIYKTFKTIDENLLLSEYLMMWFARSEFTRYCWFYAFGSARDNFEWSQMCEFRIPIPDIEVQKAIVDIYKCYKKQKEISQKLKEQIKNICPILIKGAIEEGKR